MALIGQPFARRAAGFRMKVVYHNRSRLDASLERDCNATYVDKQTLLRTADHVMLVLPYSEAAHHTVGADELAAMKPTATLTNIARGGIVDDAALAAALSAGQIAAAALDVVEGEPKVHPALLAAPNVVFTPHIGSATTATRRALAHLAVDNLIAAMGHGEDAGRPPNILNPQVLATVLA
jgi:lactate dehydrogenase-like 2-hydroxyacid dehydrogenase